MSTLTDKAKLEAEQAETEPDENEQAEEEETQPAPEPEPEPAQPSGLTEVEAEREFKRLEKLAQTYLTKATEIANKLGIPWQPCPLDFMPGLAIPRQAHEVTSDLEASVLTLIGRPPEPDYPTYEGFRQCDVCKGTGEVLTGAVIDRSRHTTCPNPNCGGKGYITVALPTPVSNGAPQYPGAELPYTPIPSGIPDQWGRPAGHRHWGLEPSAVG